MKPLVFVLGMIALLSLGGCASLRATAGPYFGDRSACARPDAFAGAAIYNTAAYANLAWSPFGRPEQGWAVYTVRLQRELNTRCAPQTAGFAARVAKWQGQNGLTAHGGLDEATFQAIKTKWQNARPFVRLRAGGVCPDPPAEAALGVIRADDAFPGKTLQMRKTARNALRRMLSAARRAVPSAARGPDRLVAFSAFRSPDYDAERCAREGNCDGVGRAVCSAHRTGLAVDLVLGAAPGFTVDSSADTNRLHQTRTPAYRWLVNNAGRFGFVNYPFEPWHWEWTGEEP